MRSTIRLFTTILLCAAALAVPAQDETPEQGNPQPCKAAEYRQFDFWIGDWEASKDGGKTWQTVFDGLYVPVNRTEATSGE